MLLARADIYVRESERKFRWQYLIGMESIRVLLFYGFSPPAPQKRLPVAHYESVRDRMGELKVEPENTEDLGLCVWLTAGHCLTEGGHNEYE